jgi:triacylglycerol lipase
MTGLRNMDGNYNNYFYKGGSLFFAIIFSLTFIIYFSSCSSPQQSYKDKLPDSLKVVSVYGEKDFDKTDMRVNFQGWRADAPQSLFLADPQKSKTYLLAYVLPPELVREVWGHGETFLSHFVGLDYANIDERTTALWLVMNAPGYFWLFTPRALVYAAKFVVEHPKFEELVKKISKTKPGEILSGNYPDIFGLAAQIAEDVREKIFSTEETKKTARFFPKDETNDYVEVPCDISDQGIAKFQDAPGLNVKFTVKHMIFYGVGVVEGFDAGKLNQIRRYAVLNAQKARIDLSPSNIITLNFINPTADTELELPSNVTYAIRVEKGFELSWAIFSDPIKKIGLAANFGRIVKFIIDIAVPNISECIPDGDKWGWAVATNQNILDGDSISAISQLIGKSWDEIVRILISYLVNRNSFIYRLLNLVGFASCAYNPDFIISTIASALGGYPMTVLYNAFTRYIPFGWELFTKPKTGVFYAVDGMPLPAGMPVIREIYPNPASSPGIIKLKTVGPACTNCKVKVICQRVGGIFEQDVPLSCYSEYPIYIPPNIDDTCEVFLIEKTPDYSKDPVVMIHGYLGGSWQWLDMKQDLIRRGWPEEYLFAIDYSDNVGCNERNAQELKEFVEEVLRRTGKDKVDIIAHSMGGLSARYYIKFLGGVTRVRDFVSLGSPHQGTLAAYFGIATCGGQQMVPGSDFLRRLNEGDPTPPPVRYTSIWSTGDEACVPNWECSYLPGARMEKVLLVGHLMLMYDDFQVLPKVIEALNGGGKNGETDSPNNYEIILSRWTVKVNRCDECSGADSPGSTTEYYQRKREAQGGGGGCSTTSPQSPYHIFAIFVIFILKGLRRTWFCSVKSQKH